MTSSTRQSMLDFIQKYKINDGYLREKLRISSDKLILSTLGEMIGEYNKKIDKLNTLYDHIKGDHRCSEMIKIERKIKKQRVDDNGDKTES